MTNWSDLSDQSDFGRTFFKLVRISSYFSSESLFAVYCTTPWGSSETSSFRDDLVNIFNAVTSAQSRSESSIRVLEGCDWKSAAIAENARFLQSSFGVYVRLTESQQKRRYCSKVLINPSVICKNYWNYSKPSVTGWAHKLHLLKAAVKQFRLPLLIQYSVKKKIMWR